MNNDEKRKIYAALSAPFTQDKIQRTDGATTGRGYSTTGIGYQHVVNRLNDVVGLGGFRSQQTITVRASTTQKGRTIYDAACDLVLQLGEWIDGAFIPFAEVHGTGGHTSMLEADAKKGAFTNGFKKAAAMFGCGRQAYEGTLDDDNVPGTFADEPVAHQQRPTPQRQSPATDGGGGDRNRLTSKQLAALWAIARKLDIEKGAFRDRVKEKFGCTLEFLDRNSASSLISELSARLGNGHVQHENAGEAA